MLFLKQDPPGHLAHIVRQFWIVENPDPAIQRQKIVPDGYEEIILHYGDPYQIKLSDHWEMQEKVLFSGQISKYFYLENTGISGMLGIKLMPAAAFGMFQKDMQSLMDRVVPLSTVTDILPPVPLLDYGLAPDERIHVAITWLEHIIESIDFTSSTRIANVTREIFAKHGLIEMEALAKQAGISRRHLEREFKKMVGLTPKYFARVIQFSYIFEAMQAHDNSWVDIALNSGYFDQSHFIRNFKSFTGESPSQYGFDEKNLSNFFLGR